VAFIKKYTFKQCGEFNKKEISRYAGNLQDEALLGECISEVSDKLVYNVCYQKFPFEKQCETLSLGFAQVNSADLAKNLDGCDGILLFAATVGVELDRLIMKYCKISPVKALIFQAIGAERIEKLCDQFCKDMAKEENIKPRFSPGYGDLPLDLQKEIFAALDCGKNIGLTLNDSMLMSPTKSVTAIVGIISK
jgi:hypothetical protein